MRYKIDRMYMFFSDDCPDGQGLRSGIIVETEHGHEACRAGIFGAVRLTVKFPYKAWTNLASPDDLNPMALVGVKITFRHPILNTNKVVGLVTWAELESLMPHWVTCRVRIDDPAAQEALLEATKGGKDVRFGVMALSTNEPSAGEAAVNSRWDEI